MFLSKGEKMVSLKQTLKDGYSFLRYLEHMRVAKISLTGSVIDLGAKSEHERYFSHIDMSRVEKIEFCDILPNSENVLQINLEKPFDIKDKSYDHVIYFNVLEHIYNFQNVILESYRILKSGGECHCIIPFMCPYNGDPGDFNRFTHTALYRKYKDAGFETVEIWPIGGGFWSLIANLLARKTNFWWLKYAIIKSFMCLENFDNRINGKSSIYALAYYVRAVK